MAIPPTRAPLYKLLILTSYYMWIEQKCLTKNGLEFALGSVVAMEATADTR